ncbi:MAG TPA: imidazoleglycerol-phosphate dehydratase HisB [Spirochaetota bacterium]|jgi:imidazoleglycerol-phosphate dehydratase|nr:MAG: Imidazoleglycerol-phosphate dehydratase [Spirochaetes bacterium ADurb.Bin133]HNZ27996.1 imidazoleglycerol-phosphate dehydratase HisB [Spirochaetota bacterium]HOF02141.1 imidazoleglycerol-phosphate dehydratase HisB [Spirochaetota bacterium]HOS33927.1 imidazoleglycerol-phosphate dehydratase HisB [Spirochaetota bacterium]HOS56884.1 imidazoleglycerol-phosphate dehydratase HisB [Spirochaetota bacterium]
MRSSEIYRETKETSIKINIELDGKGEAQIKTGIPFFDHMLTSLAKHSSIDIKLSVTGDIEVDYHHTIEDTGIVLGAAINSALGDKKGIERFSDALVPLDEALSRTVLDISGRPFLHFGAEFRRGDDGSGVNPYLFEEFFRGLVNSGMFTLHIDLIRGDNSHHIVESIFKSFAKALKKAIKITGEDIPSSKGKL